MPLVQDRSLNLLASNPARYHYAKDEQCTVRYILIDQIPHAVGPDDFTLVISMYRNSTLSQSPLYEECSSAEAIHTVPIFIPPGTHH